MTKYLIRVGFMTVFITLRIDWQKWKLSGTGIVELIYLHHTKARSYLNISLNPSSQNKKKKKKTHTL